jgi:hypothetical protein
MADDRPDIAGFPAETWDLFTAPIPQALLGQDPKSKAPYVKHQVVTEMLNRCFGIDGWSMEVTGTWSHDEYVVHNPKKLGSEIAKDVNGEIMYREKPMRYYAEAQVRLTIHQEGSASASVVREDIGSHVAGDDWSESRKAAVSEALKRAAARCGWAPNVYKHEQLDSVLGDDWRTDILPTYTVTRWSLPVSHLASFAEWFDALGWSPERRAQELALVTDAVTEADLARNLKSAIKGRDLAREICRRLAYSPDDVEAWAEKIVDADTRADVLNELVAKEADQVGGSAVGQAARLFEGAEA